MKSVSCPIPAIIGMEQLAIVLATNSELKAHKSSIEPPPLARIIMSQLCDCNSMIAFLISSIAESPCTKVGLKRISDKGLLRLSVVKIS